MQDQADDKMIVTRVMFSPHVCSRELLSQFIGWPGVATYRAFKDNHELLTIAKPKKIYNSELTLFLSSLSKIHKKSSCGLLKQQAS
jgi:predicted glycosyl hydrolase (DUF1957 family)